MVIRGLMLSVPRKGWGWTLSPCDWSGMRGPRRGPVCAPIRIDVNSTVRTLNRMALDAEHRPESFPSMFLAGTTHSCA